MTSNADNEYYHTIFEIQKDKIISNLLKFSAMTVANIANRVMMRLTAVLYTHVMGIT